MDARTASSAFWRDFADRVAAIRRHAFWPTLPIWVVGICAFVVLFASMGLRETFRVWTNGPYSGTTEISRNPFGVAFLCALLAFAALLWWAISERFADWARALAIAIPFVLASLVAARVWYGLLEEQTRPRDYRLSIAHGLPVVVVAGVVGALAAMLLAVVCVRDRPPA